MWLKYGTLRKDYTKLAENKTWKGKLVSEKRFSVYDACVCVCWMYASGSHVFRVYTAVYVMRVCHVCENRISCS